MAATNDSATITPIAPEVSASQAGVPSALYEPVLEVRQKEEGQAMQVLVPFKPFTYDPLCGVQNDVKIQKRRGGRKRVGIQRKTVPDTDRT